MGIDQSGIVGMINEVLDHLPSKNGLFRYTGSTYRTVMAQGIGHPMVSREFLGPTVDSYDMVDMFHRDIALKERGD